MNCVTCPARCWLRARRLARIFWSIFGALRGEGVIYGEGLAGAGVKVEDGPVFGPVGERINGGEDGAVEGLVGEFEPGGTLVV
jgi:hypothetical protein